MNTDELKAKLEVLQSFGLLDRVHSVGAEVVLFPVARAVTEDERKELAAKRSGSGEEASRRVRLGAAGGMQPGVVALDEVQARNAADREREARQTAKIREARAKLDGGGG